MSERVDVVVPVESLPDLRVPPLAVTTGGPEVEWVDMPGGTFVFQRRPVVRMPFDPVTAARARRHLRSVPVTLVLSAAILSVCLTGFSTADHFLGLSQDAWIWLRLVAAVVWFVWALVSQRWQPQQNPVTQAGRVVRVPHLPSAVAGEWARLNPGTVQIIATGVPIRRFQQEVYVIWSVACLAAGVGIGAALAFDLMPSSFWLWMAVPALLVAALVSKLKSQPPGLLLK